jgi:hypothetical protein
MSTTILCNLSDAQKVIDEERLYWISEILEALGVSDELFDATDIRDFRYGMEDIGIEVELHSNGNVDVYKKQCDWLPATEEHLVAQWKEPTYIRKVEGKNVHYELHLNEWSILNMRQNT